MSTAVNTSTVCLINGDMLLLRNIFVPMNFYQVLKSTLTLLGSKAVRPVICDFEAGLWGAVTEVLPSVKLQGCMFHWRQAVWRQIQAVPGN